MLCPLCAHPPPTPLIHSHNTARHPIHADVFSSSLLQDIILNALNAIPALEASPCVLLLAPSSQRGPSSLSYPYHNTHTPPIERADAYLLPDLPGDGAGPARAV